MFKSTILAAVAALTLSAAPVDAGNHHYVGQQVQKVRPYVAPHVNPHVRPARPYLGVTGHYFGQGFHIDRVDWNSPAARMGLERGDIILSFNGRRIHCDRDFQAALAGCTRHVTLQVLCIRTGRVVPVYGSLTPPLQHHYHSYGAPLSAYNR